LSYAPAILKSYTARQPLSNHGNRLPPFGRNEPEKETRAAAHTISFEVYARRTAVSSRATCRARGRSPGSNEIAATRGWPPPPYFSASEARFLSAAA